MKENKKQENKEDIDIGRFSELATTKKHFNGLNFHEIKIEVSLDYASDFELIGSMFIGKIEQKKQILGSKMLMISKHINFKDVDYDSEDVTFTGYVYKLNTPQFIIVKRNAYGKGTNYMQDIFEYHGQICIIPNSGMCFIKY